MTAIEKIFSTLSAPLEWVASLIAAFPKATLIVWVVSLLLVAWFV